MSSHVVICHLIRVIFYNGLFKVYLNGSFVDEVDAKVSIYDSALQWGDMVFEATRSFNKKQFKLREHLERLYKGIKILEIPMKIGINELEEICHETVKLNELYSEIQALRSKLSY